MIHIGSYVLSQVNTKEQIIVCVPLNKMENRVVKCVWKAGQIMTRPATTPLKKDFA